MKAKLRELLRNSHTLAFDFDGTLVDSRPIKIDAFRKTFSEFPDFLGAIMSHCTSHNHLSREDKFAFVAANILGRDYTKDLAREWHARYESFTTEAVIAAPEIPGAERFLDLADGKYPLFILSTTPHEILRTILIRKGWFERFAEVRGGPLDKGGWLKEYLASTRSAPEGLLFFGDMKEDGEAAAKAGCPFVQVGNEPGIVGAACSISDFEDLTFS